jgi:hypothetical protein
MAAEDVSSPAFDEELRLIRAAKAELNRGMPHLAEAWLDEHARRFSRGVFAVERDGLRVLARCSTRPEPALSRGFAVEHSGSPMIGQVERRCTPTSTTTTNAIGAIEEPTRE